MGIVELFSPVVIATLGSCVLFLFFRWKNLRGPPCIQGWIPWFGAGFEFGKAPLEFIEKARIKYGPIFTIFAMGNRMTFVTEEEGIDVFLKSKHVDFELAVQSPVYHTAQVPKNIFLTLHEKLYVLMKGKMGTFSLHQFTGQLTEEFHEQLEGLGTHGTMDLNNFVRHLLYPATVNTLFKKGLFFTDERKIKEFYQHFKTYDDGFEYGSQLPEWLLRNAGITYKCYNDQLLAGSGELDSSGLQYCVFGGCDIQDEGTSSMLFEKDFLLMADCQLLTVPSLIPLLNEGFTLVVGSCSTYDLEAPPLVRNWSKSKKWLLALFEKNIAKLKAQESAGHSGTLVQVMLDIVEMESCQHRPNYGLLILWASLANAPPVAFWTLAFILSHPDIHKTILEGISSVFGTAGKDKIKVSDDDLKKLLLIKWCVLEAIRLRAPGVITRKVVKPVKILSHTVPSGDLLMLSPFWLHRNPKYFPEPHSFKPERWKEANLDKNAFLDCFMAFGGGKFQCPGRWFALLEIQICILLVLYKYDCRLLDPVPKQSCLHLVGVPQPEGKCRIEYKQRT